MKDSLAELYPPFSFPFLSSFLFLSFPFRFWELLAKHLGIIREPLENHFESLENILRITSESLENRLRNTWETFAKH